MDTPVPPAQYPPPPFTIKLEGLLLTVIELLRVEPWAASRQPDEELNATETTVGFVLGLRVNVLPLVLLSTVPFTVQV
jgi:hypothetical protein